MSIAQMCTALPALEPLLMPLHDLGIDLRVDSYPWCLVLWKL